MPPENLSLEEALRFLEERTKLSFEKLGQGFIAVYAALEEKDEKPVLPQTLNKVLIINYLTQGISKKKNGVVEIDYDDFGVLPGLTEPDVLLTLQALPGVQSVDESVSNINVRGGSNDQNLILWDGIRMYQSGHFFGLITAFNPYQTKKVELIKNGTNAAYGNSVSSVVAMKTDTILNKEFHAAVGVNFINLGAFVDTPFGDKSSVQVSARTSLTPFFSTPTYEQYYDRAFQGSEVVERNDQVLRNNQEFSFNDFSLRWLYDLSEKDRIRVNFINISNALSFDENAFVEGELKSKRSQLSQNSLAAGLFYKRKILPKWSLSSQTYFSNYRLKATNSDLLSDQRLEQENLVLESNFKIISFLKINDQFDWQSGYEFTSTSISNTRALNNPQTAEYQHRGLDRHALFSSVVYSSKNKHTTFQLGGRFNYFSNFKEGRLEPRFGFNQKLWKNLHLEILGELKSQLTTQEIDYQTDFLGIEKRRWRLADNNEIPILRSKQISFGLYYEKKDWLISAEAYVKEVNGITSQSQGFQNQYQYAQITGNYFVKGIDFLLNKHFGNFSSWIGYSLMDNSYKFPALPEKHLPNILEIEHAFNFATSYSSGDFKVSFGVKWRTGKPFTPLTKEGLDNGNLIYAPAFSENLKNYFRMDISANQGFKLGKNTNAYVGISLWNLMDTKNVINAYYKKNNNEIVLVEESALGLTPNFSFRVLF